MTVMATPLAQRPPRREVLQSLSASAQRTAATLRTALGRRREETSTALRRRLPSGDVRVTRGQTTTTDR